MATHKLLLLSGDGIGPEVMAEVKKLIAWMNAHGMGTFEYEEALVGGGCYDAHGVAITDETMAKAHAADAVIFGAVGGPKWDKVPYDARPEAGLLRLRKDLGLFANLRPAICYPALADSSSLKREVVDGLDIIILRELTGGVYFGEPKTITDLGNGQKRAIDTQVYDTYEIERIARVAFELARKRRNKVTSMEKRNVMKTGVLWHEVVDAAACARVQGRRHSSINLPMPAACSWCAGPSSSTSSSPTTCSATCCPTSPPCSPARSACCRRRRSARSMRRPRSARRCTSRCTARRPTSPARASPTRSP